MDAEGNRNEQIYRPRWQQIDRERESKRRKNSVLPIIAASLLAEEGVSVIVDAPPLDDVMTISKVLESLGAGVTYQNDIIEVDARSITSCEAPYEWVRKMRASFW